MDRGKKWGASVERPNERREDHLSTGPDEDDGRHAKSGLRIPVSVLYEMEVHVCRIVPVLDSPRNRIRGGQVRRVVDDSLDD